MEPIELKTGLDADLLAVFNEGGQPTLALLAGIYRELKRLNGAPVTTTTAQPAVAAQATVKAS